MKAITLILLAIVLTQPLLAQDVDYEKRSNHYIDHILLGVDDLEKGINSFQELTGVEPRKDGRNAQLGTHSAIVNLGENMFLEIIAPDPEFDADTLDPDLREYIYDRLTGMEELAPLRWAVGTSNLERTLVFMQRSRGRPSEIMNGSRQRGWGREQAWRWVRLISPKSGVTPMVVQWADENKRPQDRAPGGCSLEAMHINTRNYKTLLGLSTTLQVETELEGSEDDSLRFELDCPNGEVVFDHYSLLKRHK